MRGEKNWQQQAFLKAVVALGPVVFSLGARRAFCRAVVACGPVSVLSVLWVRLALLPPAVVAVTAGLAP